MVLQCPMANVSRCGPDRLIVRLSGRGRSPPHRPGAAQQAAEEDDEAAIEVIRAMRRDHDSVNAVRRRRGKNIRWRCFLRLRKQSHRIS